MGKIEQISVGLPVEVVEAMRRAVASGEYASESEVLAEALRSWQDAREVFGVSDRELGALWDAGVSGGGSTFLSIEELIAEAERRAAQTAK